MDVLDVSARIQTCGVKIRPAVPLEKFHRIWHRACAGEIWQFTDVGIAPREPRRTFPRWLALWLVDKMPLH